MNIMALIVGTVYLITKRQSERCFNNVNEFNTLMSAILVRQALIAQHTGLVLPSLDEMQSAMGRPINPGCKPNTNGEAGVKECASA